MADILPLTRAPQQRLDAALRLLAVAQADQREALNAFRESLYELRDSTGRLQASVHGWQRQMAATGRELEGARGTVAQLQATAARL